MGHGVFLKGEHITLSCRTHTVGTLGVLDMSWFHNLRLFMKMWSLLLEKRVVAEETPRTPQSVWR